MKTLVWTLPTRIFHWLLALSFTIAYILGDFDDLINYHFAFGAFVSVLIIFRILFGLIGPKYSNFRDFPIGLSHQKAFVKNYFSKNNYVGHNPAAALIMLAILLVGLFCGISGYLLTVDGNSAFNIIGNSEWLEDTHEVLANVFLGLVIMHLVGVFADAVFHWKTGTLTSIFNGYKNVEAENAKLNIFQKAFSILWFIIPFIFLYLAFGLQENKSQENNKYKNERSRHDDDDDDDD
ncbi:MAG: cytochrome b/b6 domain-containing protein [Lutibacter sp.]|nr:cytochrome b/b6 domain-containing protein [Lutibacter sp.]